MKNNNNTTTRRSRRKHESTWPGSPQSHHCRIRNSSVSLCLCVVSLLSVLSLLCLCPVSCPVSCLSSLAAAAAQGTRRAAPGRAAATTTTQQQGGAVESAKHVARIATISPLQNQKQHWLPVSSQWPRRGPYMRQPKSQNGRYPYQEEQISCGDEGAYRVGFGPSSE